MVTYSKGLMPRCHASQAKPKEKRKDKEKGHYIVNKGPSSQSYGFSSGHVWMWELGHKESWAPKNWCFQTVVLEKTLESPLDCKEIQPVHPKGWCCESAARTVPASLENSQWPQDWKRSGFIPLSKKGNAKECSNSQLIALMSQASQVMLKLPQARLQQYMNWELPDVQGGFRKGSATRDQIANIHWIIVKARELQKNLCFCLLDYAKAFDCLDHKISR